LQRCRRAGLVVEQEPPFYVPAAHEFIAACRLERGQSLSLSLARVEELFRAFPRQHFLFSVRKPGTGKWAAMCIAIQVNKRVVYNLYHASPISENDLSPVVLLNEGLHAFASASGAAAVDLGTSMLADGPNESLLRFKRNLGAMADQRLTWQPPSCSLCVRYSLGLPRHYPSHLACQSAVFGGASCGARSVPGQP
jgi:hypothetical protein